MIKDRGWRENAIEKAIDVLERKWSDSHRNVSKKIIGNSNGKILVVSFTMRGDVYRIISARRANEIFDPNKPDTFYEPV